MTSAVRSYVSCLLSVIDPTVLAVAGCGGTDTSLLFGRFDILETLIYRTQKCEVCCRVGVAWIFFYDAKDADLIGVTVCLALGEKKVFSRREGGFQTILRNTTDVRDEGRKVGNASISNPGNGNLENRSNPPFGVWPNTK